MLGNIWAVLNWSIWNDYFSYLFHWKPTWHHTIRIFSQLKDINNISRFKCINRSLFQWWINARIKAVRSTTDQSFFLCARESKAFRIVVILLYFWFRISILKFNTGMSFNRKNFNIEWHFVENLVHYSHPCNKLSMLSSNECLLLFAKCIKGIFNPSKIINSIYK